MWTNENNDSALFHDILKTTIPYYEQKVTPLGHFPNQYNPPLDEHSGGNFQSTPCLVKLSQNT